MINIICNEIKKMASIGLVNRFSVLSLILWPVLSISTIWFTYLSFSPDVIKLDYINNPNELFLFILIGFVGQHCFWNITQSAWMMSYERVNGTLEMIILSPVSIWGVLIGRSIASYVQGVWVLVLFCIISTSILTNNMIDMMIISFVSILIISIPAIIWGILMNSVFLFSRESVFIFDICDAPMELFSGVKLPIEFFPSWASFISMFFPLTYSLVLVRSIVFSLPIERVYWVGFFSINFVSILLSWLSLIKAEKHYRKTGNFSKY